MSNELSEQSSALVEKNASAPTPAATTDRKPLDVIETLQWPYEPRCNPHVAALEEYAAKHAGRVAVSGLPARNTESLARDLPRLSALTYPDASLDDLICGHDCLQWLFIFDDQCDDGLLGRDYERLRHTTQRLLSVMKPSRTGLEPAAETPTELLLDSLWQKVKSSASENLQARFIKNISAYLKSYEWEAINRLSARFPTPKEYLSERQNTGAVHCCFDLVAMITNTEIDLMEEKFEELKDLEFLACQVICVTNDIFSAEKEGLHGDPNNLVFIYMNRDSIDIVEASQRAADLSQQSIDLFEEIFDKLENKYDSIPENLLKYIDGLRMWMIGNTEWSRFCSRYQSKNLQDLDL